MGVTNLTRSVDVDGLRSSLSTVELDVKNTFLLTFRRLGSL